MLAKFAAGQMPEQFESDSHRYHRNRGHWAVEYNLHWQLGVSFNEDQRRIRAGHGAENFSRLCRIALNLLKRDKSIKIGIKGKRLNAGWDHDYLLRLISR